MDYGKFTFGLLLILLGIALIGSRFGWWNDFYWLDLLQLWPLIIILIGVNIIFGKESPVGAIIFSLITIFSVAYVLNLGGINKEATRDTDTLETKTFETPDTNIQKAHFELGLGAANIDIRKFENNEGRLYSGSFSDSQNFKLKENISNDEATIKMTENMGNISHWNRRNLKRDFSLLLNSNPVYDFEINSGASNLNLDFTDLKISSLDISAGASKQEIRFGDKEKKVSANIQAGASEIRIFVPKDFALKISNESGLVSTNFDSLGLLKNGNTYTTKDFDSSEKQLTIGLKAGVSSVNVERY